MLVIVANAVLKDKSPTPSYKKTDRHSSTTSLAYKNVEFCSFQKKTSGTQNIIGAGILKNPVKNIPKATVAK